MKTQRRHELQTNVLADWLGRHVEQVKPYLKTVGAVAIAAVAIFLLWQYLSSQHGRRLADDWRTYFEVHNRALMNQDPEPLEKIAASQGDTQAGLWAAKTAADLELLNGTRDLFRDRDRAEEALERARDTYADLEGKAKGNSLLLDRVRFGLGQSYEALGDLAQARERYESVADSAKETALAEAAKQRLAQLRTSGAKKFYAWFDKQDPVKTQQDLLSAQRQSALPQDLGELPDRPDLSFPGFAPGAGFDDEKAPESKTPESKTPGSAATPQSSPAENGKVPDAPPLKGPSIEPAPTEPAPTEPAPTEPAPTEPTEPASAKPTEPAPTEPPSPDPPAKPAPADSGEPTP